MSVSEISELSRKLFAETRSRNLHLAIAELPCRFFDFAGAGVTVDRETVTAMRSVLMKPEHEAWLSRIWEILGQAADDIGIRS